MTTGSTAGEQQDNQKLAKGGRTNFLGFLLRLMARIPFLIIASRLYGASAMGRFASALVMVEFAGMLATLGQKRGLAQELVHNDDHPANTVGDALLLALALALTMAAMIYAFPRSMYPTGNFTLGDRLLVLSIPGLALGDLALAALAFRFDVAATVRARSVVEPWALSIAAGVFYWVHPAAGLSLAYLISIWLATLTALLALVRSYGWPREWVPNPVRLWRIAVRTMPLAGADAVEWGTRKLDVFILRFFIGEAPLGIYFFAQQFASLPQKLKTSFEPVLGPVITRNVRDRNFPAIARQVCQVGFWITAAQTGIALALAIPAAGLMGLGGRDFASGTTALMLLLAAEVVAATAVVSEAALIYLAPHRNLVFSLLTIGVQGALTLGGMVFVRSLAGTDMGEADVAAGALMVALAFASASKALLLGRILAAPVNNWRWVLVWAAGIAGLVGSAVVWLMPPLGDLLLGIPLILIVYGWIIWQRGFGPEDRLLFRSNLDTGDQAASESAR